MRRVIAATAAMSLLLAGCRVGPRVATFEPATRVNGTLATVRVDVDGRRATRAGELLAVRQDDFLILTSSGVERVPHDVVESAEFADGSPSRIRGAGSDRDRSNIARFGRYPLGLSDGQLEALLEAMGQGSLIEVAR